MVIFIYGSDSYRIKENISTIISAYQKKYGNGMSQYLFDFVSKSAYGDFSNAVKSTSFFDEAKLIILKNLFSDGSANFAGVMSLMEDFKIAEDKKTILVVVENRTEKELQKAGKEVFSILSKKENLVRDIGLLEGVKLSNWVKSKFAENGQRVTTSLANMLIAEIGNESWALASEINKLCNYKDSGAVSEKDISLLVSKKEEESIFEMTDAVGNKNKAKAFEMVYRLLNSGHDAHYILSMMIYHFENLLSVSDFLDRGGTVPAIAQKCGLHPFVAKKVASQSSKFSKEELIKKFNQLADLDISSKNGLVNLGDTLFCFVLNN